MKEFVLVAVGFILGCAIGVQGLVELFHKVLKVFNI